MTMTLTSRGSMTMTSVAAPDSVGYGPLKSDTDPTIYSMYTVHCTVYSVYTLLVLPPNKLGHLSEFVFTV